jgi:two-component system sensor histidine kinase HydH
MQELRPVPRATNVLRDRARAAPRADPAPMLQFCDRDARAMLEKSGLPVLPPTGSETFFKSLQRYVGFSEDSTAALRSFHPIAAPHFRSIIDDFYAAIEAHPGARAAITGGAVQIDRLKRTLIQWMDSMLLGPHDEAYFAMRARIGRVHVRIELPQSYMFTAMNRIRVHLLNVLRGAPLSDAEKNRVGDALHQILDLELAIMLETYREDLVAKNRSAERLATIGQFAASIGHELRNPLGVMESSLFLLRQHLGAEMAAEPKIAKHLDRVAAEVKRSNKTINDLLELARSRPPRRQRVALAAVIQGAVDAALLPAEIQVGVDLSAGLSADVDPDQLAQVLVNLFTNASQAMAGRGHISVEGEPLPHGARLRVRDDGPGIPAEQRYRIFEALFTTKAKGSGLGLALCRRILEAHQGAIELEPTERGASFLLTIPEAAPTIPLPGHEAPLP